MRLGTGIMCALVAAGLVTGFSAPLHAGSLAVKTEQGTVRGKTINDGKVKAFLGLPYAAPPVGDLRWKAPEAPAKWTGERDATKFGAHCAQGHVFDDMVFQDAGDSEDCLSLNVYTPAGAKPGVKLPVMFWIHGGGYSGGGSSDPRHNGDFLPTKGVVLVTINYRLGVFGFLATADLAKEANGAAGNYGLLDMVAALQWVKANIGNFGGDPDNVTIFGQSGGGAKVSALMAMPAAKGLFKHAIAESGALVRATPKDKAADSAKHLIDALGVKTIAELRAVPQDKLLATMNAQHFQSAPVVDGRALPAHPFDPAAPAMSRDVPFMVGTVETEATFFPNTPLDAIDAAKFHELVKNSTQAPDADVDQLIAVFRRAGEGPYATHTKLHYG